MAIRVLVDLEKARNPFNGFGQFSLCLGRAIDEAVHRNDRIEAAFLVRDEGQSHLGPLRGDVKVVRSWERFSVAGRLRPLLPERLRLDAGCDLWHATTQKARFLPLDEKVPVLLTIHDLNILRELQGRELKRKLARLQALVDRASAVTTVSRWTAREIVEHLELRGKRLHVIHNGCNRVEIRRPRRPAFVPEGRFLFSIGEFQQKKNFHVLVDFLRRVPGYNLVIAGGVSGAYGARVLDRVSRSGLQDRIVCPGVVDAEARSWLYANCEALLFPSLSEGFGFPVLEAMHRGKPVFCSNRTSLPEIGGGLAFYWDSFEPDAMTEVFRRGMRVCRQSSGFADRLREHAASFSWDQAALRYCAVYLETLNGAAERGRLEGRAASGSRPPDAREALPLH